MEPQNHRPDVKGDHSRNEQIQIPDSYERKALIKSGVIFIQDELTKEYIDKLTIELVFIYKTLGLKEIFIVLHNVGGETDAGLALYDLLNAIKKKGIKIQVIASGTVASMATAILQAGSRRLSLSHSVFYIHQVTVTIEAEINFARENMEENEKYNNMQLGIIAETSGVSIDELKKLTFKKDFSLDPRSAKTFGPKGLIDEIIDELPF